LRMSDIRWKGKWEIGWMGVCSSGASRFLDT
jgi:hypothetical protein